MSFHKTTCLSLASTYLSSIAAIILALAAGSTQAQEPLASIATIELLGAPMTMDAPAVSALADRARSRGQVRVIASIAIPPTLAPSDIDAAAISRLTGEVTSLAAQLGAETAEPISGLPLAVLEVTEEQLQRLIEAGLIADVIEDVPEPPALADSVPLINADGAAALGADGNGQAIAILDTGVERNHVFFGGRVVAEACFSSNSTADGATTVCPGGATTSTAPGSAAPCGHPRCDHGTHVAGIAAGQDPTRTGVAPAADLLAIQVFSLFTDSPAGPQTCANSGTASPCILTYRSDQIRGLQQVFDWRNNFTIATANMSLGGGDFTTCDTDVRKALVDQLRAARIATVIASGNDGLTAGVGAPGCITTALTVGNTTKTDAVNPSSNSAAVLDLLAPGTAITSSILGGNFGPKTGTSMAAPHVAGAVAALRSVYGDLSVDQIEQALESTGVNITDPKNNLVRPRIDLEAALLSLAPLSGRRLTGAAIPGGGLQVFAIGTSDNAVWTNWQDKPFSSWRLWSNELGGVGSDVAVAAIPGGGLEVFVIGSDGAVWHRWQEQPFGDWSGWESLEGWGSSVAVAPIPGGGLEVFVNGSDGAVWHRWQEQPFGDWSSWETLEGWSSDVAATVIPGGGLEVFVTGGNGIVYHRWQEQPFGDWSGWVELRAGT